MKAAFVVDAIFAAGQHFWMATRQNREGRTELMPCYTGYLKRDVVAMLEHGFGESFKKLREEGFGVVHFTNDELHNENRLFRRVPTSF